jgi:hypothetical protein
VTSEWLGEPIERIGGPVLSIGIAPQRGGRIVSIVDDTGREWLAQPATAPPPPARGDADFVGAGLFGWDECAPTIDQDSHEGVALGDHGDLWSQAWTVDGATMRATSPSLGVELSRSLGPTGRGVRFEYVARSARAVPWLWAVHPAFRAPAGSRLQLPIGTRLLAQDGAELGDDVLDLDSYERGTCRKFHAHPEDRVGWASLVLATGERLTMRWSASLPYLGIFIDAAMLYDEPVVLIEPQTGWRDSLTDAIANGHVATITPEQPFVARVEVTIG